MRFPAKKRDPVERAKSAADYYSRNADKVNERIDKWRSDNPEKRSAHLAVKRALYSGELAKPIVCEKCTKTKIDAHHDDYSHALEVIWLCRSHHRIRHRWLKREGRDPDAT